MRERKSDRGVLLIVSVLLHSLLALFPRPKETDPSPVPEVQASPIPVVAISQLPQLPSAEVQPLLTTPLPTPLPVDPPSLPVSSLPASSLPAPSVVAVAPPAEAIPPAPLTEPTVEPTVEPIAETSGDPMGEPTEPTVENIFPPDSVPVPTPVPTSVTGEAGVGSEAAIPNGDEAAAIAAAWQGFVDHLQAQGDDELASMPLLDIFSFFGQPGQANQFFDENNQPKLEVSSYYLFSEQTPEQVLQEVIKPELSNQQGLDLKPLKNLSSGLSYQILQGETAQYLTLVQLNERSGSVLIVSDSLPAIE